MVWSGGVQGRSRQRESNPRKRKPPKKTQKKMSATSPRSWGKTNTRGDKGVMRYEIVRKRMEHKEEFLKN